MPGRAIVRDAILLAAAAAVGWWAHGKQTEAHAETHAQTHSSSDSRSRGEGDGLGFQFGGAGIDGSLTLYNPASRTLYVYPAGTGSSRINCAYSFHIKEVGEPIERRNCAIGSTFER